MRKIITLSIISLLMVACSKKEEHTDYTVFNCGKTSVIIKPINDNAINLALDARVYDLELTESASGAKYVKNSENQKIVFWNKGTSALLEIDGKSYPECIKLVFPK